MGNAGDRRLFIASQSEAEAEAYACTTVVGKLVPAFAAAAEHEVPGRFRCRASSRSHRGVPVRPRERTLDRLVLPIGATRLSATERRSLRERNNNDTEPKLTKIRNKLVTRTSAVTQLNLTLTKRNGAARVFGMSSRSNVMGTT